MSSCLLIRIPMKPQNNHSNLTIVYSQISDRCDTINFRMNTGSTQSRGSFFCLKIVHIMRLACRHIINRGVGSIFRLRGHQKCKPQIKSRSRNLITKWKYKLDEILKWNPPPPALIKWKMCFGHIFCKKTPQGIECEGLAFTIWKDQT